MNLALLSFLVILYMPQKIKRKEVTDVCAEDKNEEQKWYTKKGARIKF